MIKSIVIAKVGAIEGNIKVHFHVGPDGVLKTRDKVTDTDEALYVLYYGEEVTDAQFQALTSIGLASCMTYGLSVKDITTLNGLTWDDIVRRG